jgi:REP element-mobilizing transposase RayT
MTFDPEIHHRRSIRLQHYDYAQAGAYFVTVCVQNRACLFGTISEGQMRSNDHGKIVNECWNDLPNHYGHVILDVFEVMPNHVHGIIILSDNTVGAGLKPAPTCKPAPTIKHHGLPEIIRAFKTFSSRRINQVRNTRGMPVWQRNYYEHVIRNEDDLNKVREYIITNPAGWDKDEENPDIRSR